MLILTPRLRLRPVQPADRDELHRLEQDPEVMRYRAGSLSAVIARDNGAATGLGALFVEDGTGELGYRFFRELGLGYATEAARAVVWMGQIRCLASWKAKSNTCLNV